MASLLPTVWHESTVSGCTTSHQVRDHRFSFSTAHRRTVTYWYPILPYLTPHFSIIAPDLRGFGATDNPPASDGYDGRINAKDMAELKNQLDHQQFAIHCEDRDATFGFCTAGLYRDRVTHLSFCEMMLSKQLTEQSFFTRDNIAAQYNPKGVWNWHIPFLRMPHVAEMLITGKEREFWTHFMKTECYNPSALDQKVVDESETYRAHWVNVDVEEEINKKGKLDCKVITVGAAEFFGPLVEEQMKGTANNVVILEIFEKCGHSLALEQPEQLADLLKKFLL